MRTAAANRVDSASKPRWERTSRIQPLCERSYFWPLVRVGGLNTLASCPSTCFRNDSSSMASSLYSSHSWRIRVRRGPLFPPQSRSPQQNTSTPLNSCVCCVTQLSNADAAVVNPALLHSMASLRVNHTPHSYGSGSGQNPANTAKIQVKSFGLGLYQTLEWRKSVNLREFHREVYSGYQTDWFEYFRKLIILWEFHTWCYVLPQPGRVNIHKKRKLAEKNRTEKQYDHFVPENDALQIKRVFDDPCSWNTDPQDILLGWQIGWVWNTIQIA